MQEEDAAVQEVEVVPEEEFAFELFVPLRSFWRLSDWEKEFDYEFEEGVAPPPEIQIKEVPYEVVKEVEVIKEVEVEVEKEIEVIKEVEVVKEVEIVKEIPVEVIREVPKEIIKEVEIIKEIEVIKEVPTIVENEVIVQAPKPVTLNSYC